LLKRRRGFPGQLAAEVEVTPGNRKERRAGTTPVDGSGESQQRAWLTGMGKAFRIHCWFEPHKFRLMARRRGIDEQDRAGFDERCRQFRRELVHRDRANVLESPLANHTRSARAQGVVAAQLIAIADYEFHAFQSLLG
jgi:hypothetical protein